MNKNKPRSTVVTLIVAMVLIGMTFGVMAAGPNEPNPPKERPTVPTVEDVSVYKWLGLIGIQYPVVSTDSSDSSINENVAVQNTGFNENKDSKPLPQDLSQTQIGILSYSHESDLLQITVGEQSSSGWNYQYDPVGDPENFISSVFGEHYAVATDNWGSVIQSSSFTIDTYFGSEEAPDTATLHYDNLSLTRQVTPPVGSARSFSITFVLTNTGDSTLENVRFFQGIDYDIGGAGNDYAWYSKTSDTVWQNDDNYFKNGFHGNRTSSHHDCNGYTSMWNDMHSGNLNDLAKYPESGTADCGIALQWDAGDLAPQASWDLTITFYFGEAAGIEANAGPDQNAGRSQPVTFDASGSSSVSNITTYEWDFDNDSIYDVSVSTPVCVYAGWTELGEYIVGLRVTDDEARNDTDTVKITVVPNVDLTVTNVAFAATGPNDGDTVIFNATVENIGNDAATDDFYVRFEVDGRYIGRRLISSLPAGSNTTITQNWIACAGSHNVTVCVDEYNTITESNETNNKMSEDLPSIQFPDLTVTNVTWAPTDLVGGDTVTFTATVKNIGAGNTSRDFYVRFEIDGKYIGRKIVSEGLDSGNSADIIQTWAATWADTVNVSVDEYDVVAESNETNNRMSKDLPGLPFPDLIVPHLTWEPEENVDAGDPVTFTATIENMGGMFYSTMSSPLKVAFLVNDEHVGSRNIVGGIRAGQPLNTTFTWIAQLGTNPAICVKADYSNIIPEFDETNNDYVETLTLVIKSPDLVITQLTFEPTGSIHVGDTVKFTAKVENIGEGNYNGNFDIGFYVDDAYTGISHVIDGVPAGESIFGTFNWTASSCSNPVIKAKADFFDSVQESDEENNEKIETLPASIPFADLEIVSINWTPTENIKDRDHVTFNVTVKNNGPEDVVTDFKVYFDVDAYFTRNNVISGGLAAGESVTTSFTWKATPDDGHNATAKADTENIVPESDETNNERIQLLPFNVSLVEIFEVKVKPAEITTGIGGHTSCRLKINNYGSASSNFDLTVAGLDQSWYILSGSSIFLSAGEEGIIDLAISVPEECENRGTFTFHVSVTSQETGITKECSATLIVEPTPIIHDLLPQDRASLGSDDITFSWNTYINATTTIYMKAEDEVGYTSYTGAAGQIHTVVASNLARNKNYTYYAESASPCGIFNSSVRAFYIGNGIGFTQDVYEFTVEHDYGQRVTIRVQNTDNEYHELLVEVPITYEDLVLGFVGEGSQDNIIPLNPGESKDVTLAIQCADAQKEDYGLIATLTSTKGDAILTDTTRIKLHVHVPRIDYDLNEISVDPITLTKTFKLTNKGDPITDLTISPADNLIENAYIEPSIEHFRLDESASIEFDVVPILSSSEFQASSEVVSALSEVEAASSSPGASGDMVITAGGVSVVETLNFAIPVGKNVYPVKVPNVIFEKHINTWFCNNRPNVKIWWEMVSGIQKDNVILDPLIIKLDAQRGWDVKPHDVYISVNGHEVGSLINTVPEGYYKFDVDPSFLVYTERGVSRNCIAIHTVHQNGGHYVVGSDMQVHLDLRDYTTHLVASSQEEANQTALDNLPPGFYKAPDSITIEEGTVSQSEVSTLLTSSTTEVLLGNPTTLRATTSPNLLVWAEFSNGDGAVYLAEVGSGQYKGTWTPTNYPEPDGMCVITIKAKGPGSGDGDLIQGQILRTVKIIKATKLNIEIIEPEDGKKIQIEHSQVHPVRITVTDDAGSQIKPSDIKILGRVVITKADKTTAIQELSNWVDGGNGNFRCDWTPESPGEYEITVYAKDLTPLRRADAKDSVTGTLEGKLKITNVKGPSGTIDPYWDYTHHWRSRSKPPKKVFDPRIPDPYAPSKLTSLYPDDFKVSFTINKKANVKYEIKSKGPNEWSYGKPDKTGELGVLEEGDHSFNIFSATIYGDADYKYYVKMIAEAVEGEAKDSDDSVAFSIERKPYFKVNKKAQYVDIEGPSFLSIGYFVLKPLIGLFNPSASAAIVYHIADLGVSSQPAADYEKIVLVEEWWIEEYNWDNKKDYYVLHHDPNAEAPGIVPPQGDNIPRGGALYVESRTYYKEKKTKYFEIVPSECPPLWYTYEGTKFFIEGGVWKLAQAGKDLSTSTKVLVTVVQGGITIADNIKSTKEVTELVPENTEIIIYAPAWNRHSGLVWRGSKRIGTESLESYEATYGPRPKPAMNFNSIMNPTQKSHTIHDVLVDNSVSEATFYINWNSAVENKTKRLTIENPQGAVIDSVTASTNPDIEYLTYIMSNSDAEYQWITELYRVTNPAPGTWKMNVSSLGTGTLEYYMGVFADSEIALSFDTDKIVYAPNESMTLEARLLYEDDPITDATVTTEIQRPDGIKETITLFDDGNHDDYQESDGIYANVYANLNIAGEYWLNTNASGSTEKGEFRRATSVKKIVRGSPVVFIDNPHDNETIDGVVNISVSAVDNSGIIANYEILIDSVKVSNSNSYSWNTFAADGTHIIEGKATDDDENTGTAQITVTVSNIPDPSDTVAPSTPIGVAISAVETGNALNVTWTPNIEPDLAGYNVYRACVSGGPYSKINVDPIEDTAYIDDGVYNSGLNGKRMYYYMITAVDVNHLESNLSGEVSGKPLASWVEPFDSDVYINTSLSHNIAVADGKLMLSEGITSGYAASEAIKPESLISWKNVYWLESIGDQIITLKISQDGIAWQMVSNGDDISGLDPAQPLFYNCTMVPDGVNESALYELLLTFTMDQEPIGFTGVIGDKGTDEDSNGLYDYLTIRVGVDIESPGHYYVVGDLKDKNGSPLFFGHQSLYYLTEGNQTINLTFEGETIYQHGVNGTYTLANLELQDVEFRQIDLLSEAYETQSYNYTEFEKPPARFDDTYSDQGTDTEGDGLYNTLTVNTGINVTTAGNYTVIGTLEDNAGCEIAVASNSSQLETGSHTMPLEFSGISIRKHKVDGPYYLMNLTLYYQSEASRQIGYRSEAYTTSAYNYTDFQNPPVVFTGNFSDRGTDTNGDGKYDYLTIDIEVHVENEGQYNISGRLKDVNGNEIVIATSTVNIVDTQTVQLNFNGLIISGHRMNGPYKIKDLLIYSVEDGSLFDFLSDAYTTNSEYNYSDFQTPPLDLTLSPTDITFSNDVPIIGEQITINATIQNDGTVDANGVAVQLFDGNPDAGGVQIGADQTISSIAHESTGTAQVAWTAIPGTHDIFVRVDPYNSIPEASENNNQAYKQITVGAIALPDLTLTSEDIWFIPPSSKSTQSSAHSVISMESIDKEKIAADAVTVEIKENIYHSIEVMDTSSTINSSWTTSPPTIDGTLESVEWVDATRINITYHSGGNCSMLVMNDEENLYIAFDVANDTTNDINWQDVAQLGFDGDHDNLIAHYGTDPFYASGTCVDLWANLRGNSTESKAGWLNMNETGTNCILWYYSSYPTGPHVLATGFSDHRIYEYSISLTIALNVSAGDTIGFNVLINDGVGTTTSDDFITQGLWPSTWNGLCDFTADGDLTLAAAPATEIASSRATIHNIGTADASNVTVQFFDGNPDAGGIQIGSNQTITSIPAGGEGTVSVDWIAETGAHAIYVWVDPFDSIQESNEENNIAFNTILLRINGDLNNDGTLTPADAVIALQIATGSHSFDPATLAASDVSGDDRVTSLDALMILQAAAGSITL